MFKSKLSPTVGFSTRLAVLAVALVASLALVLGAASAALASGFGVVPGSFTFALSTEQAGAHPDLKVHFMLNTYTASNGNISVHESLKDSHVNLPAGFSGDATAVPQCDPMALINVFVGCPAASRVGTIDLEVAGFGPTLGAGSLPLYNIKPSKGHVTEFAAYVIAVPVTLVVRVRPDDYGLSTDITDATGTIQVAGAGVTLWGVPADHNGGGAPKQALLTNPSTCGELPPATMTATSYQSFPAEVSASSNTVTITGCDKLPPVQPQVSIQPDRANAGAPAAYDIDLDVPQVDNPEGVATPPLQKVSMLLPEGTAISPPSADGLTDCSDDQLGAGTDAAIACPDGSKIGSVKIDTPLLPEPLEGSMYLGEPRPGDQFRLFLTAEGSGVTVKLRGSAVPDPVTGRLRATFQDLPQLAFSHLHVHLKGGPRAVLTNPTSCGTATSTAVVTPFGGGDDGSAQSSFNVTGCGSAGAFSPRLTAGTTNAIAGATSPFVLQVRRDDGDQDIRSMAVDLPGGLIGKVAGVPLCPSAAAAAGTCSEASRVGSVAVAVGAGSDPITLPGRVYLTEGYGGPFGLSFVVPAKVGPFDFGDVVVRAKVGVDPMTGALSVQTDDLPSIIAGIPLHYRAITVNLDRPGFMLNPTSCDENKIVATVKGSSGAVAAPASRFQVGDCEALPLKPKLLMSFTGTKQHKKGANPGLKFALTQTAGQSNLKAVAVTLPGTVGLSLGLPNPCTVAQFAARQCPATSRLGQSTVWSPLLDQKLSGGVFLVSAEKGGGLPRLGVLLDGQVPISLLSKVSVAKGHVTTTFGAPDLPISRFELSLNQKTALATAKELCTSRQKARVAILGASGAQLRKTIPVGVQGCTKKAKAKQSLSASR